jgi:Protein of unknown function (DUF2752)
MIPAGRSRTEHILLATVPPAITALAATLLLRFPPAQSSFYPQCPIYDLLHLQCPGCGATRALAAIVRGHFTEALHLNALITMLLPFAAIYGIVCYSRLLRQKALRWPQPQPTIIYAALTIATLFTITRNLPPPSF